MPPFMHNKENYTLSLGNFCRWLAGQAEELKLRFSLASRRQRPPTTTRRRSKASPLGTWASPATGTHRPDYQPGIELHARYTFFAEGARGHLTKRLTEIFDLRKDSGPQVFGLGVKELWDVPP